MLSIGAAGLWLALSTVGMSWMAAQAVNVKPKGYVCYKATKPLVIDGTLNDPNWQRAPWTDMFVDIEGEKKSKPTFKTHAKMLWDDKYLYIGAYLEEPHVWATLTQHDSVIFHDNDFEVFIDPDSDNHQYYEIEVNALGTEWDLRLVKPYRDGGPALNEWEIPGLKLATHVDGTINDPSDKDKGWSVEMALPWSVLKEFANRPAPPKDGDQWRIDFSRVEWDIDVVNGKYVKIDGHREHNWVWSPQGVIDMHRPETWGYVQFSTLTHGAADFVRDPSEPVRMYLMEIYYAEKQFHEKRGYWASLFDDLGLGDPNLPGVGPKPEIEVTSDGYIATIVQTVKGKDTKLHVRQDSRIWAEQP